MRAFLSIILSVTLILLIFNIINLHSQAMDSEQVTFINEPLPEKASEAAKTIERLINNIMKKQVEIVYKNRVILQTNFEKSGLKLDPLKIVALRVSMEKGKISLQNVMEIANPALFNKATQKFQVAGRPAKKTKRRIFREKNSLTPDLKLTLFKALEILESDFNSHLIQVPLQFRVEKTYPDFETIRKELGFIYMIAKYQTPYKKEQIKRTHNLMLACKALDGQIIYPYEKFSYNKVLGPRTKKRGYKPAPGIIRGRVVPDVGGGICQVSSTLYNALLLCNIKILERHNHSIYTPATQYVPLALDAAVAWGYKDFRFMNNLKSPILIEAYLKNNNVVIKIYAKTPLNYKVVLETRLLKTYPAKTKTIYDEYLEEGVEYQDRDPVTGYLAESYITIVKDNKKERRRLNKDKYLKYDGIIRKGKRR